MQEYSREETRIGCFHLNFSTYEVLSFDETAKELCPYLEMGGFCFSRFGYQEPCSDCPMIGLEQFGAVCWRDAAGIDILAMRAKEDPNILKVYCGKMSLPERQIWLESNRYQAILKQSKTIAFEYDTCTHENFISPFVTEFLMGTYDKSRMISQVMLEDGVLYPEDAKEMLAFRDSVLSGSLQETGDSRVMRLKNPQGAYRWYRMLLSSCMDNQTGHRVIVGTLTDVDEEMRLRQAERRRAEFDETTGIYHKAAFYQGTAQLLKIESTQEHRLVVIDIDRFKLVNDLYGLAQGDDLLRYLGQVIADTVHVHETYGRIRDDVFAMCLSRSQKQIEQVVNQISRLLECYHLPLRMTLSAGECRIAPGEDTPINLLCDRAMLALKKVKGNELKTLAHYDPSVGQNMRYEQQMIEQMRVALATGRFIAYFQPKHNMLTGEVIGAEALVRWKKPECGIIMPGEFVPLFERNGLVSLMDENVWEYTASTLRAWIDAGYDPQPVSINVSRVHLYEPEFPEKVIHLAEKYQLEPRLLQIELTESAYVENPNLNEVMRYLQDAGFAFLMDDFGSGYSSLNMLRNIPVDILKIDLHFLGFHKQEKAGKIILESVIQMAQRLELPVIAEGVETKEEARFLQECGCTMAQGFLYSRPMPATDFLDRYLKKAQ